MIKTKFEGKQVFEVPKSIPTANYLAKDQDSQHRLAFKLREDTEIIYAPILNKETGNFSSEDIDEKTGLPKKLGGGNRTLYTMKNGLARLCLDRDLGLYSRDVGLAYSYGLGRGGV